MFVKKIWMVLFNKYLKCMRKKEKSNIISITIINSIFLKYVF
jgi:hypothetical protein